MIYSDNTFIPITEVQSIRANSENARSEQNLNRDIAMHSQGGVFFEEKARMTQELYLPCIEFSFDKGYGAKGLFKNIIGAYSELSSYLGDK